MPTNLNALIRYKTIDRCLKNYHIPNTMKRLQENCSEKLAEYRGIYKEVSDRTFYDDIRVMRSEILGFNAPIEVKNGIYYYAEKGFSIFQTPINEVGLLKEVLQMLLEERDRLADREVDTLIRRIAKITGDDVSLEGEFDEKEQFNLRFCLGGERSREEAIYEPSATYKKNVGLLSWGDLLEVV